MTDSKSTAANAQLTPTALDCSKAAAPVWLVKVPKYLAKKWSEASDNTEVGLIRITHSKTNLKSKQEISFHLNEKLGRTVVINVGGKTFEENVPLEHKFITTALGNQAMYILRQSEDITKEPLTIIGKVTHRAECNPVQNDSNYIQLKRETARQFIEPKRQIKLAEEYIQKHYLPKQTYNQNADKNKQAKKIRIDKEKVLDILFNAFAKQQYFNIKDLVKLTKQPPNYLKDILKEICRYNAKGNYKNTYELKDEFKHGNTNSESNKKAAVASLSKDTPKASTSSGDKDKDDDFMDDDDDDDDDEDFDDVDDELDDDEDDMLDA